MALEQKPDAGFFTRFLGVFGYSRRALEMVWTTSRGLTFALAALTLVAGVLPAVIAYIGQLIVDGVVAAMSAKDPDSSRVLWLIALEALVVIAVAASQRGLSVSQSLLRALLGQRVNVMILEKALTLQLPESIKSSFGNPYKVTLAEVVSEMYSNGAVPVPGAPVPASTTRTERTRKSTGVA
jgi:hypothetical protein